MSLQELAKLPQSNLISPEFWMEIFPELTVHRYLSNPKELIKEPDPRVMERHREQMQEEGYFRQSDDAVRNLTSALGGAVRKCIEMGLPTPFLFLFDEAWACFYHQHALLQGFLGERYLILPDFWVWHVDPRKQVSGWTPHRDKGRIALAPDGMPLSLTMWIPLTEASPMNGCIYLVPANRDPDYNTDREKTTGYNFELASIRALPAQPGEVLCWNQAVLHWGAKTSRFGEAPRLSMALEFQRGVIAPMNQPLLQPLTDIPLALRTRLVAKQILQYQHMYAISPEAQRLASTILGN